MTLHHVTERYCRRTRLSAGARPIAAAVILATIALLAAPSTAQTPAANKKPNIVMLMGDDSGWNDFGVSGPGSRAVGVPACPRDVWNASAGWRER